MMRAALTPRASGVPFREGPYERAMVRVQMQALDAHAQRLVALSRSVRAAIVVPGLFALAILIIKNPAVAGFAVFGTFAHQVLVDYDTDGKARLVQSALLTGLGVITVSLGTLASATAWLAVGSTGAAGFLAGYPGLTRGRGAAIRNALLLSFLCAVAVPASARSVLPHVAGWVMAGLTAQPALLWVWTPLQYGNAVGEVTAHPDPATNPLHTWRRKAVRCGLVLGLAVLLTRLIKVEHAFWVVLGVLPVLNAKGAATRTFWQQQAGTLIGFALSAVVVGIIREHQTWYWLILPLVVFASVYAATAGGSVAAQAAFTVFAVVLFCILMPQARQTGILRLEDIGIGGAVSLLVSWLLRLGEPGAIDLLPRAIRT